MKSKTFIYIAAISLGIIYLLVYRIELDHYGDMARFIPATTIFYTEQYQPLTQFRNFADSELGETIKNIDFATLEQKLELEQQYREVFEDISKLFNTLYSETLLNTLFDKRFALALLPPRQDFAESFDLTTYLRSQTVIVTQPKYSADVLELLGRGIATNNNEIEVSYSQYGGYKIGRLEKDNERLSFVEIDGFFISSMNERVVRRCIDTFDGTIGAITKDKDFLAVRNKFEKPDNFYFAKTRGAGEIAGKFLQPLDIDQTPAVTGVLAATDSVDAWGYGNWHQQDILHNSLILRIKPEGVKEALRIVPQRAPQIRSFSHALPTTTMVYSWTNLIDWSLLLPYLLPNFADRQDNSSIIADLQKSSRKSITEIVNLFGEEMSLVVEPGKPQDPLNVPRFVFFVTSQNATKLQQLIEKFLQELNIPMLARSHKGNSYAFWMFSPKDGLRPVYGRYGDLFFFGNSTDLIKKIIDLQNSQSKQKTPSNLKRVDPGFSERSNLSAYIHSPEVLNVMAKLVNLLGSAVAIEDKIMAKKVKVVVEEIIHPLFEGLKMYESTGVRVVYDDNEIRLDAITQLAQPQK